MDKIKEVHPLLPSPFSTHIIL
jgi:tropomyosin, fungi type